MTEPQRPRERDGLEQQLTRSHLAHLRQAAMLAERAGASGTLRESLEAIGAQALVTGRPGLAVEALRRHLALIEAEPGSPFLGRGLGLMGLALQHVGQYRAALAHYRRCAEFYRERGIVAGEIGVLLNIGTIEGEWLRHYDDAQQSFRRTLELAEGRDDVPAELIGVARLNLGEAIAGRSGGLARARAAGGGAGTTPVGWAGAAVSAA